MNPSKSVRSATLRRETWVLIALVGLTLLAQLFTATNYPMFRDEFYYLDCASHLDFGYVDHPPLSILLLKLWRAVAGDSLFAVRFLPALAAALAMWLTWKIAKELGGGLFASALAGGAAFLSPQLRALSGFYSMNAFDVCFWAAAVLILIRIIKTENARLWIPFGMVAGLGLLNKISLLYFGAALVVGMLATPLRKHFARRQFWIGGAIAAVLFLPYVLWQFTHDFATLEFIHNVTLYKNTPFAPHQFLMEFALENNPLSAVLWVGGIVALLVWQKFKPFRALGWLSVVVFMILMTQHGKPYYAAGLLPLLFAAGAVYLENALIVPRFFWVRIGYASALVIVGLVLLPFGLRILLPRTYLAYQNALGITSQPSEKGHTSEIWPQHYSDSFGWAELTQAVAKAYNQITPEEQKDCVVIARNYGEAGAINYYGRALGLPKAYSTHNSNYFWGPPPVTPRTTYLVVQPPDENPGQSLDSISVGGASDNPYAMPYERHRLIYIGHGLKRPLPEIWKAEKSFG